MKMKDYLKIKEMIDISNIKLKQNTKSKCDNCDCGCNGDCGEDCTCSTSQINTNKGE